MAVILVLLGGGGALRGGTEQFAGMHATGHILVKDVVHNDVETTLYMLGVHVLTPDGITHDVVVECDRLLFDSLEVGDAVSARYENTGDPKLIRVESIEAQGPAIDL